MNQPQERERPAETREIKTEIGDAIMLRALWRFWLRTIGPGFVIALLFTMGVMAWLWADPPMFGARIPLIALAAALVIMVLMQLRYFYLSLRARKRLADRRVHFQFDEDGLTLVSVEGTTNIKWRRCKGILKYNDMWLLRIGRTFILLPVEGVSQELLDDIDRGVRLGKSGGRCTRCGYDLRGLREPRCPECGSDFEPGILQIARSPEGASSAFRIQTTLTEEMFLRAYRRYWWSDWVWYAIAYAFALTAVLVARHVWEVPPLSWILYAALAVGAYHVFQYHFVRWSNKKARMELRDGDICYQLDERSVKIAADWGTAELTWDHFKGLQKYADMWLLIMAHKRFLILPTDALDQESAALLISKLEGPRKEGRAHADMPE